MSTRKDFLIASSVVASLTTAAALAGSGEVVAQSSGIPDFQFDQGRFNQLISRAARHRNMFAAAAINGGVVLLAINNTLHAYNANLNTPDSDVLPVAVLYHGAAVTLALNDGAWTNLLLPALPRISPSIRTDVQTLRLSSGNPVLHRNPYGGSDQSVEGLVSRGAVFFVCNNALVGFSISLAQALNRTPGDVYSQLSSSLVNGAYLVPAGVWAVHALQEAHFTYLQTSL
jgi:intracellular sulfur oxidation DsrE/DsrF family protein